MGVQTAVLILQRCGFADRCVNFAMMQIFKPLCEFCTEIVFADRGVNFTMMGGFIMMWSFKPLC